MSFAQIKEQLAELTREQRLELAALLTHLNRKDDPEFQVELERRMAEMDAGKKISQTDLEQLHKDLIARGQ
jgi:hypothetical protein